MKENEKLKLHFQLLLCNFEDQVEMQLQKRKEVLTHQKINFELEQ